MSLGRFSLKGDFARQVKLDLVVLFLCWLLVGGVSFFACGTGQKPGDDGSGSAPPVIPEEQLVAQGVEILRSGTQVERDSVTRALYNIRNTSLLVAYLSDPDPNVKIGMVSALGYIKDKSTARALNRMLPTEDDYLLCETIISALEAIADTSSVSLLIGLFEDETTKRDMRLSLPVTLLAFTRTSAAPRIVDAFTRVLERESGDIVLCSYVAMCIPEILDPGNYDRFRQFLPTMRRMAKKRKAEFGEDLLWSNFQMTIDRLETYEPPAS
ncbi:MAG: HEAT repeat domain-containing protein [Gemmatimonadota bacterium]|nr:HEAT repeat domain-containing protein [Gemmatimonadota bacterium]